MREILGACLTLLTSEVGTPELVGLSDGWDVGRSDCDGFSDGWLLGFALTDGDSEGIEDGWSDILGFSDGWDVGQSEIEGFSDGWLLGFALTDGDPDGMEDGWPEILGFSDGWDVGQCEIEGFSDGCEWIVRMTSCVCHHREMSEVCMATLVWYSQCQWIYMYMHTKAIHVWYSLTWELGTPELLGFMLGCDVGQFDTEGCSDGWLLGFALTDGDPEGFSDGCEGIAMTSVVFVW